MIILAVLLLAVVAAVVVFVVVAGFDSAQVSLVWGAFEVDASPVWIFLLGVATLLAAELALALLRGGSRRKLAKRRELKRLREAEAHSPATTSTGTTASSSTGTSASSGSAGTGPGLTKPPPRSNEGTWGDEPRR